MLNNVFNLSAKWNTTSDKGDIFSSSEGLLLYSFQQSKAISTQ